jgi:hypothetical protein
MAIVSIFSVFLNFSGLVCAVLILKVFSVLNCVSVK